MQSLFASYGIGISSGIPAGCADGQQRVPRQQHIGAAKGKSASLRREIVAQALHEQTPITSPIEKSSNTSRPGFRARVSAPDVDGRDLARAVPTQKFEAPRRRDLETRVFINQPFAVTVGSFRHSMTGSDLISGRVFSTPTARFRESTRIPCRYPCRSTV